MEDELDSSALSTSLLVSKSTAALETTAPTLSQAPKLDSCYDRFSSPVGRRNRDGSEVGGI